MLFETFWRLLHGLSVVIRIVRLRWADHVARMEEGGLPGRWMYLQDCNECGKTVPGGEMKWEGSGDAGNM